MISNPRARVYTPPLRGPSCPLGLTLLLWVLPSAARAGSPDVVTPPSPTVALTGVRGEPGVPAEVLATLEASFDAELRALEGLSVSSPSEVLLLLGNDRQKQLLGGAPGARLGALVADLEVAEVVDVVVAPKGAGYLVTGRRLARDGRLLGASPLEVGRGAGELAGAAAPIVSRLFPALRRRPPVSARPTSHRPIRVAVADVRGTGDIPARALAALNQSLTPELRKLVGLSAIASSELRDLLGQERQKQLLGCSDTASSCMEELAGALDADELVALDLTLVGQTYALTARRTDLRKGKVVETHLRQFPKRDGEELLAVVGTSVAALYPERSLKAGRARGVEPELIRRLNPPPLPRWAFFLTSGAALATGLVGGAFGWLSLDAQQSFDGLAQRSLSEPVAGADLNRLRARAESTALTANILFATAGGFALAALVEAFFTDWKDDRAAFVVQPAAFGGGGGVLLGWTP